MLGLSFNLRPSDALSVQQAIRVAQQVFEEAPVASPLLVAIESSQMRRAQL